MTQINGTRIKLVKQSSKFKLYKHRDSKLVVSTKVLKYHRESKH